MVDIIHRIGIKAPLSKVYAALSTVEGVAGWCTKETTGESKTGGTVNVRFLSPKGDEVGKMEFELRKLNPNKEVQWRFNAGPPEWVGTDVTFNLAQDGDYTIVLFGHRNWREPVEFMAHCSMKWATFLLSLRQLVETGKGKPSPCISILPQNVSKLGRAIVRVA
ncbi:MAG TPA: SRPBCC domain-containing protein [Gemmatimonadales bacterium]|nr:SRPBCC domain-containing protein [Gemmatimonadales bacterium]